MKGRSRRLIFWSLLFVAIGAIAAVVASRFRFRPPNVIVIVVDTLRADYLGCYGMPAPISPAVDGFAKESVLFERCIAPATWTKPSVASLVSGLLPIRHGLRSAPWPINIDRPTLNEVLSEDVNTLAEIFRSRGYETAAFVTNDWLHRNFGFAQGYDRYDWRNLEKKRHDVFSYGAAWLRERTSTAPFFLHLHSMDVHGPYEGTEADRKRLAALDLWGPSQKLTPSELRALPPYLTRGAEFDATELRNWRIAYAAGVMNFDRNFSSFLSALDEMGRLDDTLVVFTADHGEQILEHGKWHHGHSLHREEIHIPLIIRLPKAKRSGRRVPAVVRLTDVAPTLLSLARLTAPGTLDGQDLLPLIERREEPQRIAVSDCLKVTPDALSVVHGDYHLIWSPRDPPLLYRWSDDPGETRNLAPDHPVQVNDMRAAATAELRRAVERGRITPTGTPMSKTTIENLRSLGYLQ